MKPTERLLKILAVALVVAMISYGWSNFQDGLEFVKNERGGLTQGHPFVRAMNSISYIGTWIFPALVALFAVVDMCLAWFAPFIGVGRILPQHIIAGKAHKVFLSARSTEMAKAGSKGRFLTRLFYGGKPVEVEIFDHHPGNGSVDKACVDMEIALDGENAHTAFYEWTPIKRGEYEFGGADVLVKSPFKLWFKARTERIDERVQIIPDISRILGADLMSLSRWLQSVGVKKSRRRGSGKEFHQLRDFQEGDSIRDVDWKATAKLGKPIVKSYEDEKDRRIYFLLDCGHTMATESEGVSHFEQALKSMFLMGYTALKHSDEVGLYLYNHPNPKRLPARKDVSQIKQMVKTVYDIEPTRNHEDLSEAVDRVLQNERRRSLIIILTHINFDMDSGLVKDLKRLKKSHVVLLANLREETSREIIQKPIENIDDANSYVGATIYEENERRILSSLMAENIPFVNCHPSEFTSNLINNYIRLRGEGNW